MLDQPRVFRRNDPDFPTTTAVQNWLVAKGRVEGEGPLATPSDISPPCESPRPHRLQGYSRPFTDEAIARLMRAARLPRPVGPAVVLVAGPGAPAADGKILDAMLGLNLLAARGDGPIKLLLPAPPPVVGHSHNSKGQNERCPASSGRARTTNSRRKSARPGASAPWSASRVGQTDNERYDFWRAFSHLPGAASLDAGTAELKRRIHPIASNPEPATRSRHAVELASLKGTIDQLAQQVQRLALQRAEQRRTIDLLRAALAEATSGRVIAFPGVEP